MFKKLKEKRQEKAFDIISKQDDNTKLLLEILKNEEIGSVFINGVYGSGKTKMWTKTYGLLADLTYDKTTKKWETIPSHKKRLKKQKNRILYINFYEQYNHNNWYEFLYFKIRGLMYL